MDSNEKIVSNLQVAIALSHVGNLLTKDLWEQLNDLDREALQAASEGGHRIEGMDRSQPPGPQAAIEPR